MAFDRRETGLLVIGDFLILVFSLWVALTLRNLELPSYGYFEANLVPFLPMFLLSLVIFYGAGLYEKQTRPIRRIMGTRILGAQAANVAIAAFLFFMFPLSIAPKTILFLYLLVSVVAESVWRFYSMRRELASEVRTPALLVGSGRAVDELYEEVRENPRYLMNFVARVGTADLQKGDLSRLVKEATTKEVQAVVLDVSDSNVLRDIPELYDLMTDGVLFIEFSTLYEEIFDRVPLDHIDSSQIINSLPQRRVVYDTAKRVFDISLAVVGGAIALPIVLLFAAALYIQGGAPFIHPGRVGKGGKIIYLHKLRTMLFDDGGDAELQKKNRVTGVGRFLRKSRIDELPQLWNVLVGDLSFVGPRPEFPKIIEVYEKQIPHYNMRHMIVPGLSGWAQINDYDAPRGSADIERTRSKLSYDLYYLKYRSFGLDLAVAMKSLRALLAFSGS